MHLKTQTKLAAYATTIAVLGGASASAAMVYKKLEITLKDPDTTGPSVGNANGPLLSISFDGTNINTAWTSGAAGTSFTALDESSASPIKATQPSILSNQNYVQSPWFLHQGDLIGDGFTQTNTSIAFVAGAAETKVYLGVSNAAHQYGWVCFSYTDAGRTITIHDAAFQTTANQNINAGDGRPATTAVDRPAPATAALSRLAGGLIAIRQRRTLTPAG